MKRKNIISLSVALAFLALSTTGLLLYLKQKSHAVEITHTIFGLLFIGFAVFHILNNWISLKAYTKEQKRGGKIRKEFLLASALFGVVLVGAGFNLPPFEPIAEAGRIFAGERKRTERLSFDKVKTNETLLVGRSRMMEIFVEMNRETQLPAIAIWTEDSAHRFVDALFVPAKIAAVESGEDPREAIAEGEVEMTDFKPETFFAKPPAASITANYAEATPTGNFVLQTKTIAHGKYYVVMEVKSNGKVERYSVEIDDRHTEIFKMKFDGNTLVSRVLVELGYGMK